MNRVTAVNGLSERFRGIADPFSDLLESEAIRVTTIDAAQGRGVRCYPNDHPCQLLAQLGPRGRPAPHQ
eukprot:6788175-Pyramimonas_sp.AAC.1